MMDGIMYGMGVSEAASNPSSTWAQQFAEIMTTNDLLTTENRFPLIHYTLHISIRLLLCSCLFARLFDCYN
jgi:hypothetical protein